MDVTDLWTTGVAALTMSDSYDADERHQESRLARFVGLVCLGGAMGGALQTLWRVAERAGHRRAAVSAAVPAVVRMTQAANDAAQAAYFGAWSDASLHYGLPLPEHIVTAARRIAGPLLDDGQDGAELDDAPGPDA